MPLDVTLSFPDRGTDPIGSAVVHRYQLREALSELFEVQILLASTDPAVDLHSVVGETVVVHLGDEPVLSRVQGLVRGVRQLSSEPPGLGSSGASTYEIDIVPPLWLTTRRRDHRIFVDKDATGVIAEILEGYGHRVPPPRATFRRLLKTREYTVQYGETDFDFIERLLAAEGITSFFDHAQGSAWTLVDDTAALTAPAAGPTPFLPSAGLASPPAHVFNVTVASRIETSAAHLRDYNPSSVDAPLDARAEPRRPPPARAEADALFRNEPQLEAYVFEVGKFTAGAAGKERAEALLDACRARARTYTLEANFTQPAGTQIEIAGHPRPDGNGAFVVVRVRVIVDDGASIAALPATRTHVIETIPASVPFLPAPRPRPRVHSNQTAVVVGGEEGEVAADSAGRVRVQHRWDRKGTGGTTRFVRVSQAWAGAGFGFFALPRVGDEVVIAYLDGDPDEPLVVGRVHNSKHVPPVSPTGDARTISTWRSQTLLQPEGYNEVLMDDARGKERLELHAQRDMRAVVEHDRTEVVKHDETRTVGRDKKEHVKRAYTLQSGSVHIACGAHELTARTIKASAETTLDLDAGAELRASAPSVQIEGGAVVIRAGHIRLEAGGSAIHIGAGGITLEGPAITIQASGTVDVDGALITLN